jgi:hypothetical protein
MGPREYAAAGSRRPSAALAAASGIAPRAPANLAGGTTSLSRKNNAQLTTIGPTAPWQLGSSIIRAGHSFARGVPRPGPRGNLTRELPEPKFRGQHTQLVGGSVYQFSSPSGIGGGRAGFSRLPFSAGAGWAQRTRLAGAEEIR